MTQNWEHLLKLWDYQTILMQALNSGNFQVYVPDIYEAPDWHVDRKNEFLGMGYFEYEYRDLS